MNAETYSDRAEPPRWASGEMWKRPAKTARVLVLTADAGSGHRSAALAIEAALRARFSASCEVRVVNPLHQPSSPGVLRLAERAYQSQIAHTPELYHLQYGATDSRFLAYMINLGMTLLLQEAIGGLLAAWPADVVVSTYPGLG